MNRMANFDPAGSGSLVFARSGSLNDRALVNVSKNDFGPRFEVSYGLDAKTGDLRGYGLYYTLFERFGSKDQLALNPPNLVNKTIASNTTPVLTPSVGFPSNFLHPSTINFSPFIVPHSRPRSHGPRAQCAAVEFRLPARNQQLACRGRLCWHQIKPSGCHRGRRKHFATAVPNVEQLRCITRRSKVVTSIRR